MTFTWRSKGLLRLTTLLLGVSSWLAHPDMAFAQVDLEKEDTAIHDGETFQIGGSCAAMAYLEQTQIKYMTSASFKDEFQSFCYPEEPFDCSDYSSLLKGMGTFEAGMDGYYCKLIMK